MARLGSITLNEIELIEVDESPIVTGLAAPSGSLAIATDGTSLYLKQEGDIYAWSAIPSSTFLDMKEPTGFVDKSESTISFSNATRTLSISPSLAAYSIYIKGTKFDISTTLTKQIPNTDGIYFFYINDLQQLDYSSSFSQDLLSDYAYVAYVIWDTAGSFVSFRDQRHGITLDNATHLYLETTRGTQLVSGCAATYSLAGSGSSNADAQIAIENGVVADEDLQVAVVNSATPTLPYEQVLSPIAKIPVYYLNGSVWKKTTATDYPLIQGTLRAKYNKNTAGVWSLEDATADNKFLASYVFASTGVSEPIFCVLGQDEYSSLADAQTRAGWDALTLSGLRPEDMKLLYVLIYETSSAFANTPKAAFKAVRDFRFGTDRAIASVTKNVDHTNLSGLANDDHLQYLNRSGVRPMTGDLNLNSNNITNINKVNEKTVINIPTYTVATTNGTLTLDSSSSTVNFITGSATGFVIRMPNATTLANGTNFELYNRTGSPITIRYFDNTTTLGILDAESVSSLILQDNSTTNGIFSPFTVEVGQAAGILSYNASSQVAFTTASVTDVEVTGISITPASGEYFIAFNGSGSIVQNNALLTVSLYKDTTQVVGTERQLQAASANYVGTLSTQAVASFNGTQALSIRARSTVGNVTLNARSVLMLRLGPAV